MVDCVFKKHTYGNVAGEAWAFLFFVVHKS